MQDKVQWWTVTVREKSSQRLEPREELMSLPFRFRSEHFNNRLVMAALLKHLPPDAEWQASAIETLGLTLLRLQSYER